MDFKIYWGSIRQKTAELTEAYPDGLHVTSLDRPQLNSTGGSVATASPAIAAKFIVEGTHRVSTPEEIQTFQEAAQRNLRTSEAVLDRQNNRMTLALRVDQVAAKRSGKP